MDDSNAYAGVLVLLAFVGQTWFLSVWCLQSWWESPVARALMFKSSALWAMLALAVTSIVVLVPQTIWRAVMTAVTVGIYWQAIAITREVRAARREQRAISGTRKSD